jgi:lipoprotein-anchoring transpeptidase ErfK/SrfK
MRLIWAACLLLASYGPTLAQGWQPWADESYGRRSYRPWPSDVENSPPQRWKAPDTDQARGARLQDKPTGGEVREGGARPEITPVAPAIVTFNHDNPVGSIVIDTGARRLYYVLEGKRAYEYTISVGREGFSWTGTEKIGRKQAWPDWYPPSDMRERDQSLPVKMTGGLKNPLGAMALYLGTTLYRIHGTNDSNSLGRAQSSGCFRMLNSNVLHLSTFADVGTSVSVVHSLGSTTISRAPDRRQPTTQRNEQRRVWVPREEDDEDWRPQRPQPGYGYSYSYGRRYW